MLNLQNVLSGLTMIATLFVLFGFARIVFSVGEHKEQTKTVPVVTFMMMCNLFLHGFILFSLYHSIESLNKFVCTSYYWKSFTFWTIIAFELIMIFDVFLMNRILLFVDKYLFDKRRHEFARYWQLVYGMLKRTSKWMIWFKFGSTAILLIMMIISFFEHLELSMSIYPILYTMYLVLNLITIKYFESIGNHH